MSKRDKLLNKLLKGQALTFDELHTLLLGLGYKVTVKGSHHTYRKADFPRFTIPKHGKTVKPVYLKQVQEALKDEL